MIGISYHSGGLHDHSLIWAIEHLAQIGYDAIEIVCGPEGHVRTGELLGPQIDAARDALSKHGLAVAAINPYTQPALAQFADKDFDEAVRRWCLLVDIALALSAPVVNFLPGWLAQGDKVAWEAVIRALVEICAYAEERGPDLAIHVHEGMIIDSPDKCLRLIEAVGSDHLKVLCDITNFYILGADVEQAVKRVGSEIVHCHLKGVVGKYPTNRFVPPGAKDDEFPTMVFLRALGEIGYSGCVSIETFAWMPADKTQIGYDLVRAGLEELGLRLKDKKV